VQITDGEKVLVLDMAHIPPEVITCLQDTRVVVHNAQFDLSFLLAAGVQLKETSCTQLAIAALTHRPMVSLEKACKEYLGVEVDKALQVSDWMRPHLSKEQLEYAARDALLTVALYQALRKQLKSCGTLAGFKLVRRCIPAIADAKARGVLVDTSAHNALIVRWQEDKATALSRLQEILGPNLNPESVKQLSDWLNENLDEGVRASWPLTKNGQLCTDKDTLEAFSQVALVQPLLNYCRVAHRLKTWGETYQRHLGPDGRLHPSFVLLGARSGRMSCRHPNVQNLPRDPALRACFIAPEGDKLVASDFAQIELRIAGLLSQDPVILSAYEQGRDLHERIVAQVTGKPEREITSEERKLGKALNFGLLYGAGAPTFQTRARVDYGLDIPWDEAQRFRSVFDQTYSRLRWWQVERQRQAEQKGKFTTVGGRLVCFQDAARCYTDSRNYPIQAAAVDLQLLAIQRIHTRLVERKLPAFLVNFIHDELVLEVREHLVDEVSSLLIDEMTSAFLELFKLYKPEPVAWGLVEVGAGCNYALAKF
jgi:DNA polymerase-1